MKVLNLNKTIQFQNKHFDVSKLEKVPCGSGKKILDQHQAGSGNKWI